VADAVSLSKERLAAGIRGRIGAIGHGVFSVIKRILCVDDDTAIVEFMEKLLAALGYRATVVTDPARALELLAADRFAFHLLITDQNMPVMTGIELAREAMALNASLPVILCTGYGSPIEEEEAIAASIRKVCMKPTRKRELGQAIRQILDWSASQSEGRV
jgi:CheY-like chemotaxis protein